MPKRITDSKIFKEFRNVIIPKITGLDWEVVRTTQKMKLFQEYVSFLARNKVITDKRVPVLETRFVVYQLKLG